MMRSALLQDGRTLLALAGREAGRIAFLSSADHEDAQQEAVLRMLEKGGKVDSGRSGGEQYNYLRRVARSGVIGYLRSRQRVARGPAVFVLKEQRAEFATPESTTSAAELGGLLAKVLEKSFATLTSLQQDVFKACLYDEPLPARWKTVTSAAFSWHAEQVRAAIRTAAVDVGIEVEVDLRAKGIFCKSRCRVAR